MLIISIQQADILNKAGKYFIYYGYNRATYSNSNIHFKGNTYNYTLYNVQAKDRQSNLAWKYLIEITIPQYNFRIGYFLDDTQNISIGVDHMKYVVKVPQKTKINGTDHQGHMHNNNTIELNNFLAFEHTDGLNYINISYNKFYPIWENKLKMQAVSLFVGGGAGIMFPRSNVTLIGYKSRNDKFKIAGYGADVQGGANYDFTKNFFLRTEFKAGYIDMPYIATTNSSKDTASQNFTFFEYSLSIGYQF